MSSSQLFSGSSRADSLVNSSHTGSVPENVVLRYGNNQTGVWDLAHQLRLGILREGYFALASRGARVACHLRSGQLSVVSIGFGDDAERYPVAVISHCTSHGNVACKRYTLRSMKGVTTIRRLNLTPLTIALAADSDVNSGISSRAIHGTRS